MYWLLRIGAVLALALGLTTTALAAEPDGKSPATAIPLSGTASGSVTGSTAGAFVFYTFNYPGDGSQGTITLTFSPTDTPTANAVGVSLWQGSSLLATMNGVSPTPGTNSVTFSSTTAGPVLAQVYNYNQDDAVSFQIGLSGISQAAAAPSAPVAGVTATAPQAGSANNPIPLDKPVTATLPGNDTGSFTYYTFNYPGDGSTQSVTLNFSPNGADVANAVFVDLFQQDGVHLAGGQGTQAGTPGQLTVSFSSSTAGPVLVQVANYNMFAAIGYTIGR